MEEKLYQYLKKHGLVSLLDTRVLGLIAFGVVALLVSWSGVKSIQANYELQKEISVQQQQNEVQKLENENLKLRNEYFKTDQFLELSARRQFGKVAPGEKVYIVPRQVAKANTVNLDTQNGDNKKSSDEKPFYQQNLESWFNFFLNRNSN